MIRRQQAIDEPLALIPFVGAESSQILQFMIILSKTVVHIVYVMKQGRHISMDAWTETEGTKRHKDTNCIIPNGNNVISSQSGYEVGYILTKLGQLPFMLFTRIA
mgnify:CR=1